jgi:hypothetical protein
MSIVTHDNSLKTMKIKDETHKRLTSNAAWGDSLDTILNKLMDEVDECRINHKR